MDNILTMFPTIGCIAVICYLVCQAVKLSPLATKYVPVISALVGGILGVAGQRFGIMELANISMFDAIATGICSGLVACGGYSLGSNLADKDGENSLSASEQEQLKLEMAVKAELERRAALTAAAVTTTEEG